MIFRTHLSSETVAAGTVITGAVVPGAGLTVGFRYISPVLQHTEWSHGGKNIEAIWNIMVTNRQ